MSKKKEKKSKDTKTENSEMKEYGVVLKKDKKYRFRIYPQKGKKPKEDDSFKIV